MRLPVAGETRSPDGAAGGARIDARPARGRSDQAQDPRRRRPAQRPRAPAGGARGDGHEVETGVRRREAVARGGQRLPRPRRSWTSACREWTASTALERVKELSPRTGVVMMTAYASVETAVKAMKLGAFDYVTKPIDIDEVRAVVARFIESDRPRRRMTEGRPAVESRDVRRRERRAARGARSSRTGRRERRHGARPRGERDRQGGRRARDPSREPARAASRSSP